jgi:hypothetical protein
MDAGLCQTCGADPRGSWGTSLPKGDVAQGTCPACGRPLALPFVRATPGEGDALTEYEMEDWEAEGRAAAADALQARAIPFRWEPGLVLVVPSRREAEADAVFDELEGEGQPGEGVLTPAGDEWGEGEAAFAALGDMFDAADRLLRSPASSHAAEKLRTAAATVDNSVPPYGFNPVLWSTASELAGQLQGLIDEGASDDDVRAGAEALRDVLHAHI